MRALFIVLCGAAVLSAACGGAPVTPAVVSSTAHQGAGGARPAWMNTSDENAKLLLDVRAEFDPEWASHLGIESADTNVADLRDGFRARYLAALRGAAAKLEARRAEERDPLVRQDLAILLRWADLERRDVELEERTTVPFYDVAKLVFTGLRTLLDDQIPAPRRERALARLRRYVGGAGGAASIVDLAKADTLAKLAKDAINTRLTPARLEVSKALATSASLEDGIAKLFEKYAIKGYEEPLAALRRELAAYDEFLRTTVLPAARTDFALPPALYTLRLERFGIDIPVNELVLRAHAAFVEIQGEMQKVAADIARERNLPSADYRDVLRALKKQQIADGDVLAHYQRRLADIEAIVRREHLVTLPERPARIRLGTPAENAQQPAPHMVPPRLVGNTGEQGEFVLPLAIPSDGSSKEAELKYDDFTYEAASWTLTAHEARPGHELQFDSMVERGVPIARAIFAFNSVNVEGWGLYSEYITLPFMPKDGQLVSLQLRLQRAARAFVDPELQQGKWTFDAAREFLEREVGLSHAFATEEIERFTFRMPGQATSYFYGYTRLRALRDEVVGKLGPRFDAQALHDAILGEGLLPPDLLRAAVLRKLGVEG